MDYCVEGADFIDKEIAYIFLYESNLSFKDFQLHRDEVSYYQQICEMIHQKLGNDISLM